MREREKNAVSLPENKPDKASRARKTRPRTTGAEIKSVTSLHAAVSAYLGLEPGPDASPGIPLLAAPRF